MNTLVSVTETIKSVGETLYISPAVLVGDIYENLNVKTIEKYPVINVDLDSMIKVADGVDEYRFYIYYADRLTEDSKNELAIQSTAITNIKLLLRKLKKAGLGIDITDIEIQPFRQQFSDLCAGAYALVGIQVPDNVNICID